MGPFRKLCVVQFGTDSIYEQGETKNLTILTLYIARGRSRMHLADVKIHKNPQTINLKMTKNREKASRLKNFTFYEIFEVGQNF